MPKMIRWLCIMITPDQWSVTISTFWPDQMAGLCLIILIVYDQIQLIVDQIRHYYFYQGFTALHLACWRGSVTVVRCLLNCPGGFLQQETVHLASDDLRTDLTKSRNNSILALLCIPGILTTLKSIGGHTPLVIAMEWRRELVAKVFPSPILCSNIISLNCSCVFCVLFFLLQEILRYSKQKREGTAIVLEEPQGKQNNRQDINQTGHGQVNQVIAHLNH